ncbi:hypothetical protein AGMMS50276_31330 [Synergistales bacterium]|nr:hypothetical protein AGMMS50276_31330 [Synergistales bacterium]
MVNFSKLSIYGLYTILSYFRKALWPRLNSYEYKIQIILPGQVRGERASLDFSDGRTPILAAHVNEGRESVFVLWDANKHDDFSYSANMQVKADVIIRALCLPLSRSKRANNEEIIVSRPQFLYDAIKCRIEIMKQEILRGEV